VTVIILNFVPYFLLVNVQ